jgi:hypothetical protein
MQFRVPNGRKVAIQPASRLLSHSTATTCPPSPVSPSDGSPTPVPPSSPNRMHTDADRSVVALTAPVLPVSAPGSKTTTLAAADAPDAKQDCLAPLHLNNAERRDAVLSGSVFRLAGHVGSIPFTALLDSGASGLGFIKPAFAKRCGLSLSPSANTVQLANGTIAPAEGQVSVEYSLTAKAGDALPFNSTFIATPLEGYDIILGVGWLAEHNVDVKWGGRTMLVYPPGFTAGRVVRPIEVIGDVRSTHNSRNLATISYKALRKEIHRGNAQVAYAVIVEDAPPEAPQMGTVGEPSADPHMSRLLKRYCDVFPAKLPEELPPVRGVEHSIPLKPDAKPPRVHPLRQQSYKDSAVIDEFIKAGLQSGRLRPSHSPYGSMLLIVKKKDGSPRVCVDYRGLNDITIKNKYPLPLMDELFDRIQGANFFTSIDLRDGFYQIRLAEGDIEKTAFRTRFGSYEYTVLPMGLCNAPSTFMQMMNDTFRDLLDKSVICFLDDILIFSKTKEAHLTHVEEVLERLRKHKLYAKLSKCEWMKEEVGFLGHRIGKNGLAVSPDKIAAVREWPTPRNVKEVRSFLGLAGFYRRFVQGFSRIALPLTELTHEKATWKWDKLQRDSFNALKGSLCSAPVMIIADPEKPFVLNCDACDYAIGATLQQDHGNGLQPVAYRSKKLSPAERNYDTREKEFMAFVDACSHWGHYLHGSKFPFVWKTDHDSLKYHMTMDLSKKGRLARWIEKLSGFDYKTEHISGVKNVAADALSRRSDLQEQGQQLAPITAHPSSPLVPRIVVAAKADAAYQQLLTRPPLGMKVNNGLLFEKDRTLVVPNDQSIRTAILSACHDDVTAGHFGRDKTLAAVRRRFAWKGLAKDVEEYVASCDACQRNKPSQQLTPGMLMPLPIPERPCTQWTQDAVSGLPRTRHGFDAIQVYVERLYKVKHFQACRTTDGARELADNFIKRVVSQHGVPECVVSDRDPRITAHYYQEVSRRMGTQLSMSTAHHPQTDGQSEREVRTLITTLRAFCNDHQDDWDEHLDMLELAFNTAEQASTRKSPYELLYGDQPRLPLDVVADSLLPSSRVPAAQDRLEKMQEALRFVRQQLGIAQQRQADNANRSRREMRVTVGDKVMLSTEGLQLRGFSNKLCSRFIGPFQVSEVVNSNAIRLSLPPQLQALHPVFNISRLKSYVASAERFGTRPQRFDRPPPEAEKDSNGDSLWEVDKILACKRIGRGKKYLVSWKGYPPEENTWEPRSSIGHTWAFEEFEASQEGNSLQVAVAELGALGSRTCTTQFAPKEDPNSQDTSLQQPPAFLRIPQSVTPPGSAVSNRLRVGARDKSRFHILDRDPDRRTGVGPDRVYAETRASGRDLWEGRSRGQSYTNSTHVHKQQLDQHSQILVGTAEPVAMSECLPAAGGDQLNCDDSSSRGLMQMQE